MTPTTSAPSSATWVSVAALGLLTITSYGSWFYAFGILIGPIGADTGWSVTSLGAVFGISQIANGLLAPIGGRLLDRFGGSGAFGVQAGLGALLLLLAPSATNIVLFGALYSVGAGIVGATGFYHVTTAAAARVGPGTPAKSIAVLTAIGAFASPIYLPLGQLLIDSVGWRPAARIFALTAIGGALIAAVLVSDGATPDGSVPSQNPLKAIRFAAAQPAVRLMLLSYAFAGASFSSALVFQVPIMESVGLTAATAASMAGLRGFMQLFGRVGLVATIASRGAASALQVAYFVAGVGCLLLLVGSVPAAAAYAVVVGIALGATSPLQSIHAQDIFDPDDLGLLMGLQHMIFAIAGGIGPFAIGLLADNTGSHQTGVWLLVCMLTIAAIIMRWSTRFAAESTAS